MLPTLVSTVAGLKNSLFVATEAPTTIETVVVAPPPPLLLPPVVAFEVPDDSLPAAGLDWLPDVLSVALVPPVVFCCEPPAGAAEPETFSNPVMCGWNVQ